MLHIVCTKSAVLKDARVLQTELAMKLGCLVGVTQGSDRPSQRMMAIDEAENAQVLVLLLTSDCLHSPSILLSVHHAIVRGKVMVPICILRRTGTWAILLSRWTLERALL